MSKHLNAPWHYNQDAGRIEGRHPDGGSINVAELRGWGHLTGKSSYALGLSEEAAMDVQDQRGKLLAAAPDLLDALKKSDANLLELWHYMISQLPPDHIDRLSNGYIAELRKPARFAIEKAEGR